MKYEINLGKNALEDLFKDEKGRKTQEIVPMDIKELKPYAAQPFKVLLDSFFCIVSTIWNGYYWIAIDYLRYT